MLEVQGLTKRYGELTAAYDVRFELQPGDVFGFIGSNGAGKTTTIRMLATLLEPTEGTAVLNGADVVQDPMAVRRMIGYMPDFFGLYEDIRVWEYLDFFCGLYSVPVRERGAVIDNVLELTDLTMKKTAFVSTLSRGMQQRLSLARCLVHDPTLLLLDEPASGLDPRARAELKELIAELGRMGKIVLISSHILPELADFCNMVGIIERGQMLAFGPMHQVVREVANHKLLDVHLVERAGDASMFLHGKPGVEATHLDGQNKVRIEFTGGANDQALLLASLVQAGFLVSEFREEGADLEEAFLKITTGAVN